MRAILDAVPAVGSLDIQEMRRHAIESKRAWNDGADAGILRRSSVIDPGEIPVLYLAERGAEALPVVYLHGGGWSICNLDTHLSIFVDLARALGRPVWAPHPRQAPEHPYPAPLDDVLLAMRSRQEKALQVCGDSAGANLVLAALLKARDAGRPLPVSAAVLFYGCYRRRFGTESHRKFGEGFGLTTDKMRRFWEMYVTSAGDYADLSQADFKGLPPVQLHLASCDPLADDTRWLHARLQEDGVKAELVEWPGMAHGFLHYALDLRPAREAFDTASRFLGSHA